MNNFDEFLKDQINKEINVPSSLNYKIKDTCNELKNSAYKKSNVYGLKNIGIAACLLVVFSGVVFAKDIEKVLKDKFNLGKGVVTAVENDYSGKIESTEFLEVKSKVIKDDSVVDEVMVKAYPKEVLMNDTTINVLFDFQISNNINKYLEVIDIKDGNINYETSSIIEIIDMNIIDESGNVLYKNFNDIDNIYTNSFTLGDAKLDENNINFELMSNISSNEMFPKSKKLIISFNKIRLCDEWSDKEVFIEGKFNFDIELPSKITQRTSTYYKVKSVSDDRFEVYEAKAHETGFEVGVKIKDSIKPKYSEELLYIDKKLEKLEKSEFIKALESKDEFLKIFKDGKYVDIYSKYLNEESPIRIKGCSPVRWEEKTEGCYILDENGKKYYSTFRYDRVRKYEFEEEKGILDFYDTFEMTKYDLTDEITLVLDYQGNPVYIVLEKIHNQ